MSYLETAKVLLDLWKFRHTHCWSSLQKHYFAAAFVSVIPYFLSVRQLEALHTRMISLGIFAVVGGALGLLAVWHFGAEYIRCNAVNAKLKEAMKSANYDISVDRMIVPAWQFWLFVYPKIGWLTVIALAIATLFLTLVNLLILGAM